MRRVRAFQTLAIVSNVIGVAAALVAAGSLLGASRAVWAVVASATLVLVTSGIGLWYVGRRTRDEYLEAARYMRDAGPATASLETAVELSDPVVQRKEIVPAFQDAGMDRSLSYFFRLIENLNLKDQEAEEEKEFIEGVSKDPSLTDQEKIAQLVQHFAPRPTKQ